MLLIVFSFIVFVIQTSLADTAKITFHFLLIQAGYALMGFGTFKLYELVKVFKYNHK